jgi:hypothetical protein
MLIGGPAQAYPGLRPFDSGPVVGYHARSLQKFFAMVIPVLFAACASGGPVAVEDGLRAAESVIPGVPVPAGSVEQGEFDGGGGVLMAFYAHPRLDAAEVLRFYEKWMPEWGWRQVTPEAAPPRQRSFERDGVPVLIGVEAEEAPASFSIIRGARGDWGFMPQLRKQE